ncbi:MAG TPA: FIST N-terminal domain-containing protein [Candidatus Nitrosotenuis sp.]|nr:FIST N-terminal domain-containing protein [Candidatus Nitrosotenuis sp.]
MEGVLGQVERPDLALVFVSSAFRAGYHKVPGLVARQIPGCRLLGCCGGGIIGGGRELEGVPAVSLTVARLPGVTLRGFHLDQLPDLDGPPEAWREAVGVPAEPRPHFVVLADPYSADVEDLALGLDYAYPASTKVGGLASDASEPGGNGLFLDAVCYRSGAVGMAFSGDVRVESVVAQGCRPIGEPMVITRCRRNYLMELEGRPVLAVLAELLEGLSERDRHLARHSLFLGLLMDPLKTRPAQGDFLIRNLLGLDPRSGVLVVGALLRPGQLLQFHLRDAETSAEDLERLLSAYRRRAAGPPAGALLFSCLGRGVYLYGQPDHDSQVFRARIGEVPLGGFFCSGEIGPVGGSTYVHGYTSCFALFSPAGG